MALGDMKSGWIFGAFLRWNHQDQFIWCGEREQDGSEVFGL
jgi:hypothetical protein